MLRRATTFTFSSPADGGMGVALHSSMRNEADEQRRKIGSGVAAGAIATAVMTTLMAAAPLLAGAHAQEVSARSTAWLRERPLCLALALVVHFGYGALAGAIYATAVARISVVSGIFFGLALWGVAVAVYAPALGLGFVAGHEPGLAALALPVHLVYGITLGAIGPRGEIVQPLRQALPSALANA